MKELLNKLIEKGWKPFGWKKKIKEVHFLKEAKSIVFFFETLGDNCRTRELVSKESGLWQFVCENGMINIPGYKNIIRQGVDTKRHKYYGKDYRYWLCESALKDESELEQFLLDNIKIGDI